MGEEGGEEEDAKIKRDIWSKQLDHECWTWAKGQVKDQLEEKKEKEIKKVKKISVRWRKGRRTQSRRSA